MEATLLAIFVPIGYAAGWLAAARIIFMMIDPVDAPGDGMLAMFVALFWPILAVLWPAFMFVTWPEVKKQRAIQQARKEQLGKLKTAELERQIYGTPYSGWPS